MNSRFKKNKNAILEFSCTGCGICCKEKGYVFFTDDDIAKASRYLNINPISFIQKYLNFDEQYGYFIKVDDEQMCHFLDENNKCIIHNAKPTQCRTFPYWKEYMDKNGNLIAGKFDRPCPGVRIKK